MKLLDLNLFESMDTGYPVNVIKSSNKITRFEFQIPGKNSMALLALKKQDDKLNIYALTLLNEAVNPQDKMNTIKNLSTIEALRVLGTSISVINNYLGDFDIILGIPEDDLEQEANKKLSVYSGIADRMVTKGLAKWSHNLSIFGKNVVIIANIEIPKKDIEKIALEFIHEKLR